MPYAQSVSDAEDHLKVSPELTTVKAKLNYINRNFLSNIRKYEEQGAVLGERNSYTKTDQEARLMRMKGGHMGNG